MERCSYEGMDYGGTNSPNRGNFRKATMFLTEHVTHKYHLDKYKQEKISKNCPHFLAAEGTTNHSLDSVQNGLSRGFQSLPHSI